MIFLRPIFLVALEAQKRRKIRSACTLANAKILGLAQVPLLFRKRSEISNS